MGMAGTKIIFFPKGWQELCQKYIRRRKKEVTKLQALLAFYIESMLPNLSLESILYMLYVGQYNYYEPYFLLVDN
jgi:hypothetical protein